MNRNICHEFRFKIFQWPSPDRLGRRLPLLGGMILLSGSSLMLFWSSSPLQMAAIYLLFGMGPVIRKEGFRFGFFLIGAVGVAVLFLFRSLYGRHSADG
jgi:hypothetical protein